MTDTDDPRTDSLATPWYTQSDAAGVQYAERLLAAGRDIPAPVRRERAEILYAFRLASLDGTKGGELDGVE